MANVRPCPANLEFVAFDIDGVFTDGRIYLSNDGIESKAFCVQDGYGIRRLLESGIAVAVISGRQSMAVDKRMAELDVRHVVQGCSDKIAAFDRIIAELDIELDRTAFVGDDVPDLPLLRHAGFAVAVANAVPAVKTECDLTTTASGGAGAVREVCDLILASVNDQAR